MRKFKNLMFILATCTTLNCSISAKTDNGSVSNPTKINTNKNGEVIHISKADFLVKVFNYEKNSTQWVYEGDKPCIIDFYADWCGPCRMVSPILEELAAQYKDKIIIYKINVDKEKELASVFGIQSIPTILFIPKEGKPMLSQGALPKEEFVKQINNFLLTNPK